MNNLDNLYKALVLVNEIKNLTENNECPVTFNLAEKAFDLIHQFIENNEKKRSKK